MCTGAVDKSARSVRNYLFLSFRSATPHGSDSMKSTCSLLGFPCFYRCICRRHGAYMRWCIVTLCCVCVVYKHYIGNYQPTEKTNNITPFSFEMETGVSRSERTRVGHAPARLVQGKLCTDILTHVPSIRTRNEAHDSWVFVFCHTDSTDLHIKVLLHWHLLYIAHYLNTWIPPLFCWLASSHVTRGLGLDCL